MRAGHAGRRGSGGSFGGREKAQEDLDLVLPPGAGAPATAGGGGAAGAGGAQGGKRTGETGAPPSFLDKLCTILGEPRLTEHISWNQEGDGVVINEPEQFAKVVLPKYYKHSNYQSFVRQLNIYGFHKTRHDEGSCEFKQPNFRRGMPHLIGLIRRKGQGNTTSAAGGRYPEGNNNHNHINNMAGEETKEMVDRVTGELRAMCNRVMHLEAEMGMIKHRHSNLRMECQALLGVVLLEGGQSLAEKAVAALRQLPHVAAEAELPELLSIRSSPEKQRRQPYQHQNHRQRLPGPSPPTFQATSSTTTSGGGVVSLASGADAGLSPVAAGPTARPGEGSSMPPFSASGAALASVVAAAIASTHPPPPHVPAPAPARTNGPEARGSGGQARGGSQAAAAAAPAPAPGGFPLAFWPPEAPESRDSVPRAGDVGEGAASDGLPMVPAAAAATSLAPKVSFGAHGSSGSSGSSSSRGFASNAGAGGVRGGGIGGASSSPSLFSDHGIGDDGKGAAPAAAADAAAAAAPAVAATLLQAELSAHRGGSEGVTPVSVTSGGGEEGREEAWHAGVGEGTGGRHGDGQAERGEQGGTDLEAATTNKRKAAGGAD